MQCCEYGYHPAGERKQRLKSLHLHLPHGIINSLPQRRQPRERHQQEAAGSQKKRKPPHAAPDPPQAGDKADRKAGKQTEENGSEGEDHAHERLEHERGKTVVGGHQHSQHVVAPCHNQANENLEKNHTAELRPNENKISDSRSVAPEPAPQAKCHAEAVRSIAWLGVMGFSGFAFIALVMASRSESALQAVEWNVKAALSLALAACLLALQALAASGDPIWDLKLHG